MGRYYLRPNTAAAVDYGSVDTDGSGTVLGDNNDGTGKKYFADSGSILTFPVPSPTIVPTGRSIIAVRVGHRQVNTLALFNGWVSTYLRYKNKREETTRAYKQDGYSGSAREVLGPALYNKELAPWTIEDIGLMGAETGAAVGEIGPNKNNRWCVATEVFIQVIWNDPVPVPSSPYPANNQVIDTSSVQFSAQAPAPQSEQPVQTVFQVCRVNTFDDNDVRNFIGGLNGDVAPTARSYYVSEPLKNSYTNLGPGDWYLRIKNRDYLGNESAWGATTKFNITHTALPIPSLMDPLNGQSVNSPYRNRRAKISTQPSGGRRVGVTWQFSKQSDFSGATVQWTNSAEGTFVASSEFPFEIAYDPTPNAEIEAGLNGGKVAVDDPSQYLSQGTWYARVRCTDVWGQSGAWSGSLSFTVTHPPVPTLLIPSGGVSFDQAEAPVRWSFTDPWPGDTQTAYQMRVLDASSNVLQDTGKTASGVSKAMMNVPTSFLRQILTVTIDTWDADDVKSLLASRLTGTLRLSKAPVTTIIFPGVDESIDSGQPNFQWSSVFAAAGITQKSFRLKVTDRATGKLMYDSGLIGGTATSHLPTRPILKNLAGYQVELEITDSEDLSKKVYQNFSTNFDRPESVISTVETGGYRDYGYTEINWPTGNPDPFFKEWRVYRRKAEAISDDDVTLAGVVEDPDIRFFHDWLIAGAGEFVYSVVQVAYRYGSLVESEHVFTAPFYIYSESFWLIVPTNPNLNVKLHSVKGDKYTSNREIADYNIIRGGRRRAYGGKLGKSGNLTVAVRNRQGMTASEFIDAVEAVADNQYSLFMRDPFGRVTQVALGELSNDRLPGVGTNEFGDIDIPYVEVGGSDEGAVKAVGGIAFVESPPGSGLMLAITLEAI
ncbi:minor tail protein [Gordonia phage Camerico]|nr:minor tail protein [Gordonia phage Camerico]